MIATLLRGQWVVKLSYTVLLQIYPALHLDMAALRYVVCDTVIYVQYCPLNFFWWCLESFKKSNKLLTVSHYLGVIATQCVLSTVLSVPSLLGWHFMTLIPKFVHKEYSSLESSAALFTVYWDNSSFCIYVECLSICTVEVIWILSRGPM